MNARVAADAVHTSLKWARASHQPWQLQAAGRPYELPSVVLASPSRCYVTVVLCGGDTRSSCSKYAEELTATEQLGLEKVAKRYGRALLCCANLAQERLSKVHAALHLAQRQRTRQKFGLPCHRAHALHSKTRAKGDHHRDLRAMLQMAPKVATHRTFDDAGQAANVKQRLVAEPARLLQRLKGALKRLAPLPQPHKKRFAGDNIVQHPSWLAARRVRTQLQRQPAGQKLAFDEATGAPVQQAVGEGGLQGRWSKKRVARPRPCAAAPTAARKKGSVCAADVFFADEAGAHAAGTTSGIARSSGPGKQLRQHARRTPGGKARSAAGSRATGHKGKDSRHQRTKQDNLRQPREGGVRKPASGAKLRSHPQTPARKHSQHSAPLHRRGQHQCAEFRRATKGKDSGSKSDGSGVHPSWLAAQQRRQAEKVLAAKALHAASGKRVVFDD